MHDEQSIDQYFTEQIVGPTRQVAMGPSVGQLRQPSRGVLVEGSRTGLEMTLLAVRSAWAAEPGEVLVGRPVSLPRLARWRIGLMLVAWLAWSAGLVAACAWWWRV
ncbi:hypothetical protein KAK06_00365 [Ideonella sp. 4Y11]|uniref:Uncharacterized protein n=1 Tax=Ideonella aquatica TaxID=2824119 RepID=A0A940YFT4_9BURK|nr:hypothetical protein [Ideonella aquatica]MBQ0957396.1 hypothetical protein [Ideonella aquatica]